MSDNVDISHLPSPDELASTQASDISHLPSPQELSTSPTPPPASEIKPDDQYSALGSVGMGAAQGVTLGYADELEGALKALGKKGQSIIQREDEKDLKHLYRQYRDIARQKYKQAEEQNPGSYTAGQVGGGVAGAVIAPESLVAQGALTGLGTSEADLTDPTMANLGKAAVDTTIGAGLGKAGEVIGKGVSSALSPQKLETAGSKLASSAMGVAPSKEFDTAFQSETGKLLQGPDIIKGIGKTGEETGILTAGGPDSMWRKAEEAISVNKDRLAPILTQTQEKIDQQLPETLEQAGNIGDKAADLLYNFRNDIRNVTDNEKIMSKIEKKYIPQIEKMSKVDGDLGELIDIKQKLQQDARDMGVYKKMSGNADLTHEADFVNKLSGVLRGHIEDLAGAVDPNASQQIANTNETLSKLYTIRDSTKQLAGSKSTGLDKLINLPTKVLTGSSPAQLVEKGLAKTALGTSRALQTPAGKLIQKASPLISKTAAKAVASPFVQEYAQNFNPISGSEPEENYSGNQSPAEATKLATNLYTATDDSLKDVASKMETTPGIESYGNALKKAIETNDSSGKNKAIFLILQNPISRKMVKPEGE